MSAIHCVNVSKAYGSHWAVRNLHLRVPRGSICALVGPNGAGKSSTIKMMATLMPPTAGSISIDGLDIEKDREAVRHKVGFVADHFTLYEDMSVSRCLEFYARCYGLGRRERRTRIAELLELLDLSTKAQTPIAGLSRGMKQRVGLGRAMIHDPPVLLLDEPASGLDPSARIAFRDLMVKLRDDARPSSYPRTSSPSSTPSVTRSRSCKKGRS